MPRWDPKAELCGNCGHWSESGESGLTPGTGYCTVWEKLTDKTHTCDRFVARPEYAKRQAEANREYHEAWDD